MNLMNLHVLFAPEVIDLSGPSPSPISAMRALTLDDEVQYRCAGFVQAEIERFAEELAESGQNNDQEQGGNADEDEDSQHSDSDEDEPALSKKKKGAKVKKGKKSAKKSEISTLSTILTASSLTDTLPALSKKPLLLLVLSSSVNTPSSVLFLPSFKPFELAPFICDTALSS